MTPEIKRQVWAWTRGAFLGMIGCAAVTLLAGFSQQMREESDHADRS